MWLAFLFYMCYNVEMNRNNIISLMELISSRLEESLNILLIDYGFYVHDIQGRIFHDFDELNKHINDGTISAFIDVDALVTSATWGSLET